MKTMLITPQSLAEKAADRWYNQYKDRLHGYPHSASKTNNTIYNELCALDNPTPESVAAIIGNDSWTRIVCSACNDDKMPAVVAIDVTHGEYATHICEKCARQIIATFCQ